MKLTDMPISRRIMVGFLCKKYKTKYRSSPTRVNDIGCFGESSLFLWYPSHCCAIGYTRLHRSVFVPDCYIRSSPAKEWCRTVMINFSIDCSLWHRDKTPNLLMFPAYKLLWIWFIMLCVTVSTQRSLQRMSAFKISYSNGFSWNKLVVVLSMFHGRSISRGRNDDKSELVHVLVRCRVGDEDALTYVCPAWVKLYHVRFNVSTLRNRLHF